MYVVDNLTLELIFEDEYDVSIHQLPCSRTGVTCVASDSGNTRDTST